MKNRYYKTSDKREDVSNGKQKGGCIKRRTGIVLYFDLAKTSVKTSVRAFYMSFVPKPVIPRIDLLVLTQG